MVTYRYF